MKLLKMKRIEDIHNKYEIDPNSNNEWFIHLETEEEYTRYLTFVNTDYSITMTEYLAYKKYGFWSGYMSAKLGDYYEDIDIFHYFSVNDNVPAVGETFVLDDLKWERVE